MMVEYYAIIRNSVDAKYEKEYLSKSILLYSERVLPARYYIDVRYKMRVRQYGTHKYLIIDNNLE